MRKNQIEITVRRFSDEVPFDYGKDTQVIHVYADSNNLYEALSVAYSEILEEVRRHEVVPAFGAVEVSNNVTNERLV